jgi:hypothetical protein
MKIEKGMMGNESEKVKRLEGGNQSTGETGACRLNKKAMT